MISITPAAIERIKTLLAAQSPAPIGFRIAVRGGGCSGFEYCLGYENKQRLLDKIVQVDGVSFFVDQASMLYLDGTEIDYMEGVMQSGFVFHNPNVKRTCGCGNSFGVT